MCKIITTETAFYAFVGLLHEPDTNKSFEAQGQWITHGLKAVKNKKKGQKRFLLRDEPRLLAVAQ